jgi:RNA-binding protein
MDNRTRQQLKARAHALKPVVLTGQAGISDALLSEIDGALEHHELIKVRISAADRDDRKMAITRICDALKAQLVQQIGHVATIYRTGPRHLS